jgi:hypothetical protein
MSNAIPEDLKGVYADALMDSSKPWFWSQILPSKIVSLIERIAAAEAERDALNKGYQEVMAERLSLREELATARQTIERLSAPVSDAECNVVMFRVDSGHTFGVILDALIAARKDAK